MLSSSGALTVCRDNPTPVEEGAQGQGGAWVWWLSVAGLLAGLMAPFFFVDVPPVLDYPNHLARRVRRQ
jgi:hypothetical protein